MGAPRKKQKKDRAAAGPAVDLAETEIDNWGWRRVKLPAATDAADEDMGGLYMLEEIDDVDIEYRANEAGPGKAVRFKKIGKGRPGKTKSQSDDPAEDDLIANANFIDIDDFKEEDAKALRGKKGSKGSKTDAAQQGVAAEAKPSSKGKRKREGKEVSDDDEEEQDEEAESVGSSDPHDAEDIEEADDDEVKGADEDEIEDADEGEESESEDGSDDDETGGEISQESKVALEAWAPFNLSSRLLRGLSDRGFMSPTPIQSRCLPVAIQWKRDIVGTAETVRFPRRYLQRSPPYNSSRSSRVRVKRWHLACRFWIIWHAWTEAR